MAKDKPVKKSRPPTNEESWAHDVLRTIMPGWSGTMMLFHFKGKQVWINGEGIYKIILDAVKKAK